MQRQTGIPLCERRKGARCSEDSKWIEVHRETREPDLNTSVSGKSEETSENVKLWKDLYIISPVRVMI